MNRITSFHVIQTVKFKVVPFPRAYYVFLEMPRLGREGNAHQEKVIMGIKKNMKIYELKTWNFEKVMTVRIGIYVGEVYNLLVHISLNHFHRQSRALIFLHNAML